MAFAVLLTENAEFDLEELYRFVAVSDSVVNAGRLLDALEAAVASLADMPQRGNVPKELATLGLLDYREIRWKPYRIIYRMLRRQVVVHCVVDGRRDMQSLLQRRLLS